MGTGRRPQGSGPHGSDDPREELLGGGDIRATLRRLWEGDPLDLRGRAVRRLAERALMIDATRRLAVE